MLPCSPPCGCVFLCPLWRHLQPLMLLSTNFSKSLAFRRWRWGRLINSAKENKRFSGAKDGMIVLNLTKRCLMNDTDPTMPTPSFDHPRSAMSSFYKTFKSLKMKKSSSSSVAAELEALLSVTIYTSRCCRVSSRARASFSLVL